MRAGKILGLIVGGVVVVIVIVLLAVWLSVNPNDYKPRIVAAVRKATGRELVLEGDIKLSVFPWIALELGPASLGNPPGFGDQPFVSFKHASFRAKVLPLLSKRLEIGKVELDGLDARLLKSADGKGNWEGFGQQPAGASGGAGAGAGAGPDDGEAFSGIAGIKITNARVSYNQYTLENVSVETGTFAEKTLVPVVIHFDANRGVATESLSAELKFDFSGDFDAKAYRVAAFDFHGTVKLANDSRPVRWNFSTPALDVNLNAQTLSAPAFVLDVAGAQVSGSLAGTKIIDDLSLAGAVKLAPLVVREYLPRLALNAPKTQDPRALSSVSLSTAFEYRSHAATLDGLEVTLDDTHLKGSVAIVNLETDALKFDLAVDSIDLDRYLPPQSAAPESQPKPVAAVAGPAGAGEAAKPLEAVGTLTVGAVHLAPLDLTAVKVTLTASGGVMQLYPLQAAIDGGQYSGNITLDSRESVPLLSMDEHLTGIDVGQLVSSGSKAAHVSGKGNVSLKGTARGTAADAFMKTLNGHLDTFVTNGSLEGVDIGFQLGRAEAVLRRQDIPAVQDTKRTKFDTMKMSADIVNGVATTQDLTIASSVLKVTGEGTLALPTKALEFSLVADTLKSTGSPLQIPIKVTGTTSNPTVRPDLEALLKGQLRQKVQDLLQDKLKGLFNR